MAEEPIEVYLPGDHPLAAKTAIRPQELAGETFLSISGSAMSVSGRPPALRLTIDRYLKKNGVNLKPRHEVDNLGAMMSLIVSTRGVALLPRYARTFLPEAVTTRPLHGVTPTIDLSVACREANGSPVLKQFLARLDKMNAAK